MKALFVLAAAFAGVTLSDVIQIPVQKGTRTSRNRARTEMMDISAASDARSQPIFDYFDGYYLANVTIGTPPQSFSVMLDTATSDFWVINSSCKKEKCKEWHSTLFPDGDQYIGYRNQFNPTMSSTFTNTGRNFTLSLGYEGKNSGIIGEDVVSMGGLSYATQGILVADVIGDAFKGEPIDGVLGLAWPALAYQNVVPVMQNMLPQLDQQLFTIWLDRHPDEHWGRKGGLITYGALDNANCDTPIRYVGLSSKTYWKFPLNAFTVGGYSTSGTKQAFSDTGSLAIGAPAAAFKAIVAATGATASRESEYYDVPCKGSYPDLVFNIAGTDYTIPSSEYVIAIDGLQSSCYLAVLQYNGGGGFAPHWLLGDPFIRTYCNVYDIGNARLGFAKAHHKQI